MYYRKYLGSKERKMIIEAIIVSHNYGDFLAETLPRNLQGLDNAVVVTHPQDRATKILCNKLGVNCVETDVMHYKGDAFNKGMAIGLGLAHLRHEGWLLHLDADILLPDRFRNALQLSYLNPKNIYGADRLNIRNYENWKKNKNKRRPQWQHGCLTMPVPEFPIGARLVHDVYGYCPIGFFQLWHSSVKRKYPIAQGSAEHTDVLFAVQWPRENRILLPEFFVYHLESEQASMGANWQGRKTKEFK